MFRLLNVAVVFVFVALHAHAAEDAYTSQWWADGWRGRSPEGGKVLNFQTSRYGLSVDVVKPAILHLGAISNPASYADSLVQSNDIITSLPAADLRLTITADGTVYTCTGAASKQDDEANFPIRLIESGRFVQRSDILNLAFQDAQGRAFGGVGRLEIVAWPERLHLILEITPTANLADADLTAELLAGDKVVKETKHFEQVAGNAPAAVGLAWSPTPKDEPAVPANIAVSAKEDGASLPVTFDPLRGWHYVDLPERQWDMAKEPDRLDRYPVKLTNSGSAPRTYNLLFAFDGSFQGVTGLCPILRDAAGNPTGIPVQISKNWHQQKDRHFLYEGPWLHGFTQITVPAGGTWEGELAIAYAQWGGVPSASHAQLCLIGWGVNQRWDQAAIGSWGESICYDPDINLNRSMIDDVRPLMVTGMSGGQWEWTCNVGGGDFLACFGEDGERRFLTNVRTAYLSQGPNLTDVVYAGTTSDGAISARIEVMSPRCDDVNRSYHRLRYDVLKDVTYSRIAFYQVGADNYNDHQFAMLARGNADGLAEEWQTAQGGKTYLRQGIPMDGAAPWVSLHKAERNKSHEKGAWANRGMIVRAWKARLGGADVPQPHLAVFGTDNGIASANAELAPPPGLTGLKAGDFVEAEVEFVILPMAESDYYGPNEALRADLKENANTWRPVHRLARNNNIAVEVSRGKLVRAYPPMIAVDAEGRAEFRITQGAGYLPITFAGLRQSDGYTLECDGKPVDQSRHGKDYWQTRRDSATGTWSQVYNVTMDGAATHSFRFGAAK